MKLNNRVEWPKKTTRWRPFSFLSHSLRGKVTVYILALLTIITFFSSWVTIHIMNQEVKESIVRRAESLSRSIASAAGYHLILKDILALDNLVYKIKSANPDITSIAVIGPDEEIIVHSEPDKTGMKIPQKMLDSSAQREAEGIISPDSKPALNHSLVLESPISFMEQDLGRVRLEVDWSVLHAAQTQARKRIWPLFGLILAAGVAGSLFFSNHLTRPIKELSRGVEEMKRNGQTQPIKVYSLDELGQLTASFNEMASLVTRQRERLATYAHELEEAYVATVKILAAAIEARDPYTLGHSTRVSQLAVALAKEMGLPAAEVETIEIACLFHDVGKIKIPDSILHKKGRLEAEEIKEMKRHPEYGAEILSKAPCLYKYIPAVRHHHEWYNGTGYPDRLSREEIPLAAAIIALADSFDAMTSDRPYRKALRWEEAMEAIAWNSGRQFHPDLVNQFLKIIEKAKSQVPIAMGTEKTKGK